MLGTAEDTTDIAQKTNGNIPYVELFFRNLIKSGGTKYLATDLFGNKENNADKIPYNASDDQVKGYS